MKLYHTLLFLLIATFYVNGQSIPAQYSRIKIDLSEKPIDHLAKLGLETDHGVYRPGQYLINDFSSREIDLLAESNYSYEILISDVQAHYIDQNKNTHAREFDVNCSADLYPYMTPENYEFGSMGGYLTYDELLSTLDSMNSKYPHLISKREQIGEILTHEGRPIFWLKVGDKPREDEDEPKILYTALHHAREANSLSQMVFYLWYLLENYETNEEVRFIVDNTSMYFIPCVNPDGYVFNEETNPSGGGLWRKNRRPISGNGMGVDLNRNYGYEWGYDDVGSSTNPISETYRGTEGFSEPETQAVRDFSIRHDFKITLNYHTYGNLLIYPWGFNDSPTPDDFTFKGFSEAMTAENGFFAGTGIETVGYNVNGDADDWMYGERGSFALTPEVGSGSFGFWPPKEAIDKLNKSVLAQNIIAAKLLHNYAAVEKMENEEESFRFSVKKYSLGSSIVSVKLNSLHDGLVLEKEMEELKLQHLAYVEVEFPYELLDEAEGVADVELVVDFASYVTRDTFSMALGDLGASIVFEDAADDFGFWTSETWGLTNEVYYSESGSMTDSPDGLYSASTISALNIREAIDLSNAEEATLRYQARWEIEEDFDYAQVLVSKDSTNFSPLCGRYTEDGISFQDEGQPVYDGSQKEWVSEEIDLSAYLGGKIWIRFIVKSDEIEQQDGLYIDDIEVTVKEEQISSAILDLDVLEDFHVVPNPFTTDFQVVSRSYEDYDFVIYDEMGRKVQKENLTDGIYFIEVKINGERKSILKAIKIK